MKFFILLFLWLASLGLKLKAQNVLTAKERQMLGVFSLMYRYLGGDSVFTNHFRSPLKKVIFLDTSETIPNACFSAQDYLSARVLYFNPDFRLEFDTLQAMIDLVALIRAELNPVQHPLPRRLARCSIKLQTYLQAMYRPQFPNKADYRLENWNRDEKISSSPHVGREDLECLASHYAENMYFDFFFKDRRNSHWLRVKHFWHLGERKHLLRDIVYRDYALRLADVKARGYTAKNQGKFPTWELRLGEVRPSRREYKDPKSSEIYGDPQRFSPWTTKSDESYQKACKDYMWMDFLVHLADSTSTECYFLNINNDTYNDQKNNRINWAKRFKRMRYLSSSELRKIPNIPQIRHAGGWFEAAASQLDTTGLRYLVEEMTWTDTIYGAIRGIYAANTDYYYTGPDWTEAKAKRVEKNLSVIKYAYLYEGLYKQKSYQHIKVVDKKGQTVNELSPEVLNALRSSYSNWLQELEENDLKQGRNFKHFSPKGPYRIVVW